MLAELVADKLSDVFSDNEPNHEDSVIRIRLNKTVHPLSDYSSDSFKIWGGGDKWVKTHFLPYPNFSFQILHCTSFLNNWTLFKTYSSLLSPRI